MFRSRQDHVRLGILKIYKDSKSNILRLIQLIFDNFELKNNCMSKLSKLSNLEHIENKIIITIVIIVIVFQLYNQLSFIRV